MLLLKQTLSYKSKPTHPTLAFAFALLHLQFKCKCRELPSPWLYIAYMDEKQCKVG
jgi:hypothetical protein